MSSFCLTFASINTKWMTFVSSLQAIQHSTDYTVGKFYQPVEPFLLLPYSFFFVNTQTFIDKT